MFFEFEKLSEYPLTKTKDLQSKNSLYSPFISHILTIAWMKHICDVLMRPMGFYMFAQGRNDCHRAPRVLLKWGS